MEAYDKASNVIVTPDNSVQSLLNVYVFKKGRAFRGAPGANLCVVIKKIWPRKLVNVRKVSFYGWVKFVVYWFCVARVDKKMRFVSYKSAS